MAEAIVSFVVRKLGDLIMKEAELLGGVKSQVSRVQTELMNIRCYLASADSKQRKGDVESALVENWLNQLRDVAYRIEDAIDIFYVELEGNHLQVENTHNRLKYCCYYFFGKVKNLRCKFLKVPGLHKLGTELADIQKELEDIFVSKDKYGITLLPDQSGKISEYVINEVVLPNRRAAYQDVDDIEIVGQDDDKDNIRKLLLSSEKIPRRAVITIVGPGGLGKTTLARRVYKSVKADFEYHTMLSVSQQFSIIDILTKILREVLDVIKNLEDADPEKQKVLKLVTNFDGNEPKKQDMGVLISRVKKLLSGMRYLIILDDVWVVELWDQLKYALPDDKNGSRVMMTSRNLDVANSADSRMEPYMPNLLNEEESCDLLLRKALQNQEVNEVECPSDLIELAKELSKKCEGLPLALIVLGGILSTRRQTYRDWNKVLDTMDWHQEGKDCMNVLAMSYEDMPYYLKPCFTYLSSFPEDYEISARVLMYMWIAEGFIPEQEKKTLEETAEVFLEQLYQRSMVQVSRRYSNGSIKYFRVHDLLHDLAMHEARKVNFVTIFQKLPQDSHPDRVTRRVSIQADQSLDDCSEFMKYIGSNTRSLLWFDLRLRDPIHVIDFRLLRVLKIEGDADGYELRGLEGLIHLKYLEIRNFRGLKLPSDFRWDRLQNLETLIGAWEEQKGLWSIRTLRHVILPHTCVYFDLDGPPVNADLRNLQTLRSISSSGLKAWHKNQLPLLNNLRKFGLEATHEIESVEWEMVGYLLATLSYLLSLKISVGGMIPKEIVYPMGLPNYQNLESLYLLGRWDTVTVDASLFPPHLIKLELWNSQLAVDPMPELGKLKSLKKLKLGSEVYAGGKKMVCPAGFPALQTLVLCWNLIEIFTVMEGVMPKLKHLINDGGATKLNLPPELKHFEKIH